MKRTELGIVKFAIAPTDELAPLGIDEPLVYWRTGLRLRGGIEHGGIIGAYTSERAAWIDRERTVSDSRYMSITDAPIQCTRAEVCAAALEAGCHTVKVRDETGTVVDSWTVTA